MFRFTDHRVFRVACPLFVVLVLLILGATARTQAQQPAAVDPAEAAQELLSSLSAEQRQAIGAALAGYEDELGALAEQLAAVVPNDPAARARVFLPLIAARGGAVVSGNSQAALVVNPDAAATGAALDGIALELEQVQAGIAADLAGILNAEQLALYQNAMAAAPAADVAASANAELANLDAVGCFNAAQWTDYAFAYNRAAKSFAFHAAFNVDFGTETPEAVQSYISFNEAEAYLLTALQDLSTASVLITASDTLVQNINGGTLFGVKGDGALKVAEDRIELATAFALEDYLESGGVVVGNVGVGGNYFAYFAFAYGDIADFFADEALLRTPNCY